MKNIFKRFTKADGLQNNKYIIKSSLKMKNVYLLFCGVNSFDKCVYVKVTDTGLGIKNEFIKDLFSPFTQEEHGYTRTFEGNGLELTLVKKYCEINNAKIHMNSIK